MAKYAIAATWREDGTLLVLVKDGAASKVAAVAGGKATETCPAVRGSTKLARIAVAPSGAVVTATREGKALLVTASGERKAGDLGSVVVDVVTSHQIIYAATTSFGLLELDEKTGEWFITASFEDALSAWAKKRSASVDGVHSIVSGKRGPIVAVRLENYHHHLLLERAGKQWRQRAQLQTRVNAIAWDPKQDVVYAVGDEIHAVDARGKVKAVPNPDDDERDYWSACWARDTLVAGTLDRVDAIDPRKGLATTLLSPSRNEVGHNHALAARGKQVVFVRGGEVFVLGAEKFVRVRV
jgi:hypothetical protein